MTIHSSRELDDLKKDLLAMGAKVEANVHRAIAALIDRRSELVDEVLAADREIDACELQIDRACHRLLALHKPVADELRLILTVSRVCSELERMGDHAKNVAKCAKKLCGAAPLEVTDTFAVMVEACAAMVTDSLDAFMKGDADLADAVRDADEAVDEAYHQIMDDLAIIIRDHSDRGHLALRAAGAARDLERIGDIATNVAKNVIFLVRGENVAHPHLLNR
ncbi:MAG: phosphate signaling complex protein PhoU [Planctomycetota bacterium]|jgi:phosphate transport system protein|nr:phosphate signaling complex protein PhoU [Planctomycetota bacterium]